MPTPNLVDVINGATPLEMTLAEVHPRLHLNAERLELLRTRKDREPWKTMIDQVRRHADHATTQIRAGQTQGRGGPGGRLPEVALAFLLDGKVEHLEAARDIMRHTCTFEGTDGHGSFGGCWLYGLAIGYDWLFGILDPQTLATTRDYINRRGREHYQKLADYSTITATWYTCNHLPNYIYDLAAGGLALYDDVPHMAPWIKLASEKTRQMIDALGPDGVSQEGVGYGEFYAEYLVKTVDLINDVLGVDLFAQSDWLRNTGFYHLYSSLPRRDWAPRDSVMCFGDGVRYHWHGPDTFLLRLAGYTRDPRLQWFALEVNREGLTAGSYINPIWYDPTVPAIAPGQVDAAAPTPLPPTRHFPDQGLSVLRSDWNGHESVLGFHCAPFSGHKATRDFNADIGGGHMHPDAGSVLLFAHGDWLLCDTGYSQKLTAYRNTILVNGIGQTGERSVWFEGVELRRERRGPRIMRTESGPGGSAPKWESIAADLTQAYEHAAKAKRIERHVVYIRPDCWILIDRVAAEAASTFDLYFHSDHAFVAGEAPGVHRAGGKKGALTLRSLAAQASAFIVEKQVIEGISGHGGPPMDVLRVRNAVPAAEALFVTVLEAHAADAPSKVTATLAYADPRAAVVELVVDGQPWRVELTGSGEAGLRVAGGE
ncbi:MAG: heparinase II/III family protein [Planctomycetota bacterium]|nr:heparinase II/III family protein [Planctomycetota bacterium]